MQPICSLTKVDINHLMLRQKGAGNKEELESLKIIFVARRDECLKRLVKDSDSMPHTSSIAAPAYLFPKYQQP